MADLPIDLPDDLAAQLASCLDVEAKIPRALEALGPLAGRDVVLLGGGIGLRARQLAALGARLIVVDQPERVAPLTRELVDLLAAGAGHQLVSGDLAALGLADGSADALVSLWSGFRQTSIDEVAEADRVLRAGGRLLVLHDYGRDDVSRMRDPDLPEYGAWSRRDGWFLRNGFKLRVIHCWWTWAELDQAQAFLRRAFGEAGARVGAALRRPRLSYNVAIYHRAKGGMGVAEAHAALAGRA